MWKIRYKLAVFCSSILRQVKISDVTLSSLLIRSISWAIFPISKNQSRILESKLALTSKILELIF